MTLKQALPFNELTALSPLDGRYREKTQELAEYFSEYALIKTRIEVEAVYLIALSDERVIRKITQKERKWLETLTQNLTFKQIQMVKEIEKTTRHDVKAMEKAFRTLLKGTSLEDLIEIIHIGLTSEDVNNLSVRLMITRANQCVLFPLLEELLDNLISLSQTFKKTPMLARTHGQAAVPTTLGKEIVVFAHRIAKQIASIKKMQLSGKLNGAVGNFNALVLTYPDVDWISFSENVVKSLGFVPNIATAQINTYEDLITQFHIYERINTICIDFSQDMWRYISDGWFVQEAKKGEIGSSTMPQKVNPIDFENAEGNLGIANTFIEFMARKLPISRLQRDLSDSTVIRNIGSLYGYNLLAYKGILSGLSRVRPHIPTLSEDLNKNWVILTEGVQTVLRSTGAKDPYTLLATLTRGNHIHKEEWVNFIQELPVDEKVKTILTNLTPETYSGLAQEIVEKTVKQIKSLLK